MVQKIGLDKSYPDALTYSGPAGLSVTSYNIIKTVILDSWIKNELALAAEQAVSDSGGVPLRLIVRFEDMWTYYRVEITMYSYKPEWAQMAAEGAQVQLDPAIVPLILTYLFKYVLPLLAAAIVIWLIGEYIIKNATVLFWGPGNGGGGFFGGVLPTAILVFSFSLLVTAVARFATPSRGGR